VSWLDGGYRGRRITLAPEAIERGRAVAEQQGQQGPRVVNVDVSATITLNSGDEETVTQAGGPKLTAAWLRALADHLDPRPAITFTHGGGASIGGGTATCR